MQRKLSLCKEVSSWKTGSSLNIPTDSLGITRCRCPEQPIFHADPLLCGAFPASPVHATNLHLGRLDRKRTWFSLELLDLLASLRKNNAHTAVDSFTKTLSELHWKCCKQSLSSYEVVRRQLGKAIEENEILLYNCEQQVLDLIEDPTPIGCCAACSTEIAGAILIISGQAR